MNIRDDPLLPGGWLWFEQDGRIIVLDDFDHPRDVREFESVEAAYLAATINKGERRWQSKQ